MVSKLQAVAPKLWGYWTHGKGLGKWVGTATPYRSLVAALTEEGVPPGQVHGLAANIYHAVKGSWPGKQGGRRDDTSGDMRPDDDVRCVVCGDVATARVELGGYSSPSLLVCSRHQG